jgi:hypothetical protein
MAAMGLPGPSVRVRYDSAPIAAPRRPVENPQMSMAEAPHPRPTREGSCVICSQLALLGRSRALGAMLVP